MSDKILIRDVMSRNILECVPTDSIRAVAKRMSELKCSSILVVEDDQAAGIWTEKDALKVCFDQSDAATRPISEVMSFPVKTISGDLSLEEAAIQLNEAGIRHYLVADASGARIGIISQTDIVSRQEIEHFLYMSKVSSIVTHAPSIPSDATLAETSALMLRYRLEALAVSSSSEKLGIVSERDIVRALACDEIPATVAEISTPEMVSIQEDDSIFYARNFMIDRKFRHLGVKNTANEYIGIISFSSILDSIRENSFKAMSETMEKALYRKTAEFEAIFHAMADCVIFTDKARIVKTVNPAFTLLFGYQPEEAVGKHARIFYADEADDKVQSCVHLNTGAEGDQAAFEMAYRRKDGSLFTGETVESAVTEAEGGRLGCLAIIRNITERKVAESRIKAALSEKEVMLREIHHRVKNNLQVVSSLLSLQASTVDDDRYRALLADSQERVQSMALVHEQLYQSDDLSHVDFKSYVRTLAENLMGLHASTTNQVRLKWEMTQVNLTIETAIPCGLIINELITNCLKHAFPEERGGEITLSLAPLGGGEILFGVRDTGIGLAPGFEYEKIETLGLQLIYMLVKQIHGTISVKNHSGTAIEIRFKELQNAGC